MTTAHAYPSTPAPWADVVPGMGPVTVDLLLDLPDDGYVYEVVQGVLVRMGGSGEEATTIAAELLGELRNHVRSHRLGRVTGADGVYKFAGAETGLIPDVGFFAFERHPQHKPSPRPVPFAPDLAVEVVSPDQKPDEMAAKAQAYLQGGTLLVWVIWPSSGHIDVWHPDSLDRPARTLNMGDIVDGEDVVPGFTYPVASVFDPLADTP